MPETVNISKTQKLSKKLTQLRQNDSDQESLELAIGRGEERSMVI